MIFLFFYDRLSRSYAEPPGIRVFGQPGHNGHAVRAAAAARSPSSMRMCMRMCMLVLGE